jgi:hypothetical protein
VPPKKGPLKKAATKKTPAKKASAKKLRRPVLVEYLLRLVWDEREYTTLVKGGAAFVAAAKAAGLTPKQRTAVLQAYKGDGAQLRAAVAAECAASYGPGELLWNSMRERGVVDDVIIFFTHPPHTIPPPRK